jgi:hypothetical protein
MTSTEIKNTLREGTFKFKYTKVDGTERTATGTLNEGLLSEYGATPKGTGTETTGVVNYFDTDVHSWRSFREENFICFL